MDDESTVLVCSACLRATCLSGRFLCENATVASSTTRTVAQLRELEREHPSWWKLGDSETPRDADDVRDLAIWNLTNRNGLHPDIFVEYLVANCGLDALMVRNVLRDVWPEAAALVEVPNA
jgi:hypothetical protein